MLVRRVRRSDVFRWINQAQEVFREQPFVFRRGERLIYGVIDLLIRDASGRWRVVDYKTGMVSGYLRSESGTLPVHARRYHLQVGVYAAAVQELTGETPAVYIHYLRYAANRPDRGGSVVGGAGSLRDGDRRAARWLGQSCAG